MDVSFLYREYTLLKIAAFIFGKKKTKLILVAEFGGKIGKHGN